MASEPTPQQAEALAKIGSGKLWRCGSKVTRPTSNRYIPLRLVRQLAAHGWLFHVRAQSPAEWHLISDKAFYGMALKLSAQGRAALNARRAHGESG